MHNLFFSGLFWGIVLILLGILLLLKYTFQINLPVGQIFFSLLLIFIGIMVLTGKSGHTTNSNTAIFSESNFKYSKTAEEYSAIFGKGELTLPDEIPDTDQNIKVTALFGEMNLKLSKDINYIIHANSAFGTVNIPGRDHNQVFGSSTYQSPDFIADKPKMIIKADAVFGAVNIF